MARGRPSIPQRTPVFVGCEGQSEQGYVRWLDRLARSERVHVNITARHFGGGDPLALVEAMLAMLKRFDPGRTVYRHCGLFLDAHLLGENPDRDGKARALASSRRIQLIWQDPVHEAFVLRHFEGNETRRPPDGTAAERALRRVWPEYRKGMDATGYERVLDAHHLARVRRVEPEFDAFLVSIGWN